MGNGRITVLKENTYYIFDIGEQTYSYGRFLGARFGHYPEKWLQRGGGCDWVPVLDEKDAGFRSNPQEGVEK
jgi:hypothetical protein